MKLNFIPEESEFLPLAGIHACARTHTHKRGVNPTEQPPRGTSTGKTNAGGAVTFKPRKVLNEKMFYYSVLKSSRGKLQEYVLNNWGFYSKNSKEFCPDLNNTI